MIRANKQISLQSVLIWGLLNLLILGIGVMGFPLWAHHPFPRESIALQELVCGQVILASWLFPKLAETPWTLAINMALVIPIDKLGGILSNAPHITISRSTGCVEVWILGLGLWRWAGRNETQYLILVVLASCFTVGGCVVDYLRCESLAAGGLGRLFIPCAFLPKLCACVTEESSAPWLDACIPCLGAFLLLLFRRRGQSPSTSLHRAA